MVALGRRLGLLLLVGAMSACVNATQRGEALYAEGRFIEAAEVFEHGEAHLQQIGDRERVRYGLYRGATLLKLGDLDGASRWLYFAQQAEVNRPGSLEPADLQLLRVTYQELDRRRASVKPNVDPLVGAMAHVIPENGSLAPDVVAPDVGILSTSAAVSKPPPKASPKPKAEP